MATTTADNELLRIRSIEVDGLFHLYNHRITLHSDERVTIIYGANGVGKTAILRMIQALAEERFSVLRQLPFRRFALSFVDGTILEIRLQDIEAEQTNYEVELRTVNGKPESSILPTGNDVVAMAESIANTHSGLKRISDDLWVDMRADHYYNAESVITRFGGTPSRRIGLLAQNMSDLCPLWLRTHLNKIYIHLIETQRLLREKPRDQYSPRHNSGMVSTVLNYAQDLKRSISEVMAQYGRRSQALDQSFPQRLIASEDQFDPIDIKNRMGKLEQKRSELKKIGILDEDDKATHPFDVEQLDNLNTTQKSVMTLYVGDSEKKLQVLDDLAYRITLLLDNINQKFQHKQIRIDRNKGLLAEDRTGQPLPLDVLSSGEQHELVLYYDLLFRVKPNTLVLIDEPELSLHVTWQKRFIPDLLEIARTVGFDVLVATHSPFIAGDRTDLMVALEAEAA